MLILSFVKPVVFRVIVRADKDVFVTINVQISMMVNRLEYLQQFGKRQHAMLETVIEEAGMQAGYKMNGLCLEHM